MKLYLKNPDTLKSRIKKLKRELNTLEGVSPSLGFCRDLVAQSLNWDDWNELHLGHQAPGSLSDRILFSGRWCDDELNKKECFERLYQLLSKHFGKTITSHEAKTLLSMTVWPISQSIFHDMLNQNKTPNLPASDIPDHYLRDNILIDSPNREAYQTFQDNVLYPRLSKHSGIIFCSPLEAREAIKYFHDRGIKHGVVTNSDYLDLGDKQMLSRETTINHQVTWKLDNDGVVLKTVEHLLSTYTEGKMQPSDRNLFCSWVLSKKQEGDSLSSTALRAMNCDNIHDTSKPIIDSVIERLQLHQHKGNPLSLSEITNPPYPLIIISHTDNFLGHTILSALMQKFIISRKLIQRRERSAPSEKTPRLLVTGYNHQIVLPGFAVNSIYSGSDNWSVITPQEKVGLGAHIGMEIPFFISNVSNIILLSSKTIKRVIFREPLAQWFCMRNGKGALEDVARSISSYGQRDSYIKKQIYAISLKYS